MHAPMKGKTFRECIAPPLREAAEETFSRSFLDARCISATDTGKCSFTLEVSRPLTNLMGNLHGGASCSIIDIFSTLAVRTVDDRISVSVDMAQQFASPASVGDPLSLKQDTPT